MAASLVVAGVQGNAFSSSAVTSGVLSNWIDTQNRPFVATYGTVSTSMTIGVIVSDDQTNFYQATSQVMAAAGTFYVPFTCAARYVGLQVGVGVSGTATAVLAAKTF